MRTWIANKQSDRFTQTHGCHYDTTKHSVVFYSEPPSPDRNRAESRKATNMFPDRRVLGPLLK